MTLVDLECSEVVMLVKQYLMNPSIFSWFTPAIYEFLEKWGWFNVVKDFRFFFSIESYDMLGCHRQFAHFLRDYWWASSFLVNLSLNHTVLRIPGGFYGVHIHFLSRWLSPVAGDRAPFSKPRTADDILLFILLDEIRCIPFIYILLFSFCCVT